MSKSFFPKEFLAKIKEQLLAKKEDLENELAAFAEQNPRNKEDFSANFPELGDKADENAAEVAEYSNLLTLESTLENALQDVNEALERLERGAYGICRYCQKPISEKRLLARPVSSSCIDCKKKLTLEA
jgi:DnaK suppressor protein